MQLIILGSGVGVPTSKRSAPGLCIQVKNRPVLFDSGSGTTYQLPKVGIDYHRIDHVFYTHVDHPDHINDLSEIIFANKYDYPIRKNDLNITGPVGIRNFYENMERLFPTLKQTPFSVNIKEVNKSQVKFNGIRVMSRPLYHQDVNCVGYRLEYGGRSIVYSGDTDYCDNIVALAKESDLLVLECSFPDELKVNGHLTPSLAGRIANEADAKRLVLTHIYPICDLYNILDQARKAYQKEIIIAQDLMRVEV
ncbi:MAG: MBL fold metallo-hydrolase [Thermodesulfobacteriota bacterium]|nr:MBL fold metallo-hydrolase [Thermodesulfobacteriota bacterium]